MPFGILRNLTSPRSFELFELVGSDKGATMASSEFCDYYELLEVSSNANSETIERVFRYLAKKYHPDVAENTDMTRFTQLVEAYEILRDPNTRTTYDVEYERQKQVAGELIDHANAAEDDVLERHRLLTVFYAQRRRDMKQPGVGVGTLEKLLSCPEEVLNFHIWYLGAKGWVERLESGLLAITAEGVDKVENSVEQMASAQPRIEHKPNVLPEVPMQTAELV